MILKWFTAMRSGQDVTSDELLIRGLGWLDDRTNTWYYLLVNLPLVAFMVSFQNARYQFIGQEIVFYPSSLKMV